MLGNVISLIWCHFYSCYLSNCLFAEKFSNCSNSLNFEAKINCNTIKPNVPKWRKTCTGLKFDLVHFNGPQTKFKNSYPFEGPCTSSCLCDACLRLTPSQRMTEYSTRERKTSITQVSSQISSAVTELDTGILELEQDTAQTVGHSFQIV